MKSVRRLAFLWCAGIAVAVALAVAGVDWLDTGTAPLPPATTDPPRLAPFPPPRLPIDMAEDAIERLPLDLPERVRVAEARGAAMDEVVWLADVPGQHAESALADTALSHAEPAVREEAIHALGERSGTIALSTLQQALQDASPRVRRAAVHALAGREEHEAVLALASALYSAGPSMRVNAMDALGGIGGPGAIRYMEQMLGDETNVVREAAAEWLAELSRR